MKNINKLRSKALTLAHKLKAQMPFGAAQIQAWKVVKACEAMKSGAVVIQFDKTNGERRRALATLKQEDLPPSKGTFNTRKKTSLKVNFFDKEISDWRSFLPQNFISLSA